MNAFALPSRSTTAAVAALLLVQAALGVWAIRRNSVTVDEVSHLPAGIAYLETREFDVYHQNPPLVKVLCALPALAAGARSNYEGAWRTAREHGVLVNHVAFGRDFQLANRERYHALYAPARLVVLAISLLGGLVIFQWARGLHGDAAGLLALALWTLSPSVLAHGSLVTTDVPAAVAAVFATYLFRRWLRQRTLVGALWVGAALGIAQIVKFSSLILLVIWPLLGLAHALTSARRGARSRERDLRRLSTEIAHVAVIVLVSVLVINLGYVFEGVGNRLGAFDFMSLPFTNVAGPQTSSSLTTTPSDEPASRRNRFRGTALGDIPVPLPAHYLLGLDEQLYETNTGGRGYPMYLRGELRRTGWRYYYLYALLIKVPLGTWVLFIGALASFWVGPRPRLGLTDELFIWLPPAVMLASMSLLTDINIGIRYALPCLPFACIGASRVAAAWGHPAWRGLAVVGVAATAFSTLSIAPHFLAYFNVLAGGPRHGHEHLIDSNLDWGQDLLELKKVLDRRGHRGTLPCALFGNVDPSIVGIESSLIPPDPKSLPEGSSKGRGRLSPGLHAVSVNFVMGMPYRLVYRGRFVTVYEGAYAYFHRLQPVDRAGYSIWLYELSAADCERLNEGLGLAPEGASSP